MHLLVPLLLSLLAQPALADDAAEAEARRLARGMESLAQKNAWDGVERNYQSIRELGVALERGTLVLAADAARSRGDVVAQLERLDAARKLDAGEEVERRLAGLRGEFGLVDLSCKGECPTLIAVEEPFRPDLKAAIAFANEGILTAGRFQGYVPVGSYGFGHTSIDVLAGAPPVQVAATSKAARVRGLLEEIGLPRRFELDRKTTLALNGAGILTEGNGIVYVSALYLKTPGAIAEHVIADTGPKRILVHWLVPMRMADVGKHFESRFDLIDDDASWGDQQLFLMLLDHVRPGDRLVFDWIPKKEATRVWVNDEDQGLVQGEAFMRLLWASFLGEHAPSAEVARGMLGEGLPAETPAAAE